VDREERLNCLCWFSFSVRGRGEKESGENDDREDQKDEGRSNAAEKKGGEIGWQKRACREAVDSAHSEGSDTEKGLTRRALLRSLMSASKSAPPNPPNRPHVGRRRIQTSSSSQGFSIPHAGEKGSPSS